MGRRLTQEEFIEKAKAVHCDTYDYSKVEYVSSQQKVRIICQLHGEFQQTAGSHLQGVGCPICANRKRSDRLKEIADDRVKQLKQTCMERYGVENPMQVQAVKERHQQSVKQKYGVSNVKQVPEIIEKGKETCMARYGATTYAGSDEGKKRIQATMLERYGAPNFMQSEFRFDVLDEMLQKSQQTQLERYGATHYAKSECYQEHVAEYKQKEYVTKRKNGSFTKSNPEDVLYDLLCSQFGQDGVVRQYVSTVYPFACDFHISSRNLYIELNATWTHGGHWYESDVDSDKLRLWSEKAKDSQYYQNAIYTWTDLDKRKRKVASENTLNYVVFWDVQLRDAELWFALDCPDGQDWKQMYSWL